MILFYGRLDDSPLRRAVDHVDATGSVHAVLDQRQLANHELGLAVVPGGWSGHLVASGHEIALETVTAVFARPLELPRVGDPIDRLRAQTFHQAFVEWLDYAACLVVNRPAAMESNSSKPFQAQLIARFGFDVPETLVTNDADEVLAFRRRHGSIIYKSASGVRSIVRELDEAAMARLDRVRALPTMFQAHVPGVDVRVHVVGNQVFATEVRTEATDYRYAGDDGLEAHMTSVDLPATVESRCVSLSARLGLPFCGIDLRRSDEGRWVCFEVNPMPAYSFFEAGTGQDISGELVRFLSGSAQEHLYASG